MSAGARRPAIRTRRCRVAPCALVAGVLLCGFASGGARAEAGIALRVQRAPFRLTLVSEGRTLARESARPTRLRYQLLSTGQQFTLTRVLSVRNGAYRVGTNEPGRTATVRIKRTRHGFRVVVRIEPGTDVQQVYDSFETNPGDHFLGGGERGGHVDLRGQLLPTYASNRCSYAPVPFFASSAGWGLRLVGENVSALAFPGAPAGSGCELESRPSCGFPALSERVDVCMRGSLLVEDLFAGSLAGILADYQAETGPPRKPPPSELAAIKWRGRTEFTSPADVFEDIDRFRAAGIPIGWVLLDDVWQTCMGTLRFDSGRFPDPAALVREVHGLGVRFMLWVSPKSVCGTVPSSDLLGPPTDSVLDLTKPPVVAAFQDQLRQLVALGIDGVKADRGDEVDLEPIGESLQNDYPLLYARAVMDVLPGGSVAIFRTATAGSQRVIPGLWAGDQTGDFGGLRQAILFGETAAMSGFPTWGSDIGGYNSQFLTPDVFARWAQLGSVSPIFEVGGAGPNSRPWTLGSTAVAALRRAAILHYELFPYLYGLVGRGLPVLRPLGYAFPDDPGSWEHELEFLVGPDLLAAPVVETGTTPSVYLPPGTWIDLYRGRTVSGGTTFRRSTPLTQFPLYLRARAVVPFNLRTPDSWWGTDELEHPGRAGFLAGNGAVLDLRHQPPGVQVFVPSPRRPRAVTLAGKRVAWSWSPGPLPGVVIRLHGPTVRGKVQLTR
ncbi:MAG TPA: TIM-barrel domain-containing protein [Gaiellaceae bacterium]|nr:TIM-barrel domain-containing protein [Gaiellaceae bacterium]